MRSRFEFHPRNTALLAMYQHLADAPGNPVSRITASLITDAPRPFVLSQVTLPMPDNVQARQLARITHLNPTADLSAVIERAVQIAAQEETSVVAIPAQDLIEQIEPVTEETITHIGKLTPDIVVFGTGTEQHVIFQAIDVVSRTLSDLQKEESYNAPRELEDSWIGEEQYAPVPLLADGDF